VPLGQTVQASTLYRYYPEQGVAHDYPLGMPHVVLLALALLAIASHVRSGALTRWRPWFFLVLLGVAEFLQLQAAAAIWRSLPLLGYLQFPWRLLGMGALGWAWLLGYGLAVVARRAPGGSRAAAPVAVAAVALLALTTLAHLPGKTVAAADRIGWETRMWQHDREIGQVGATWTAEYVPVWVTVDRSAMPGPPGVTDRPPSASLPVGSELRITASGLYSERLWVRLAAPARLSWHVFYYPGWQVYVDGRPVRTEPFTDLGMVSAQVPAGEHELLLRFGDTLPRTVGRAVSALAVAVVVGAYFSPRPSPNRGPTSLQTPPRIGEGHLPLPAFREGGRGVRSALALLAFITGAAVWFSTGCSAAAGPVFQTWGQFGDQMALVGWRPAAASARAGEVVGVELFWMATATPREELKAFLHLVASDGRLVTQGDGDLVGGFTDARRLVGGEVVPERRYLALPADLPAGRYALYAGLYRWPQVANLRVSGGEQAGAERLLLGYLDVTR